MPPAILAKAIETTRLINGDENDTYHFCKQQERTIAAHCARPRLGPPVKPQLSWEAFSHLEQDAEDIRRTLTAVLGKNSKGVNILLYGLPGTGKTEFARTLCGEIGAQLYAIGENEQSIASAFAEALQNNSFLVFDEVDSLLMDRQSAQRSWEVSLVNEFLSQMELHPLPFACTTNQWDIIDPAAARRFVFRAEFYYLNQPRINRAFELFFNSAAPSSALALTKLTPADFANVRERAEILGFLDDPERIAHALAEACRLKPGGVSLGF